MLSPHAWSRLRLSTVLPFLSARRCREVAARFAAPAAFDAYYFGPHVPICADLPGIQATTSNKGPLNLLTGTADWYLTADVTFNSLADLQAGCVAPLGRAPGQRGRAAAGDEELGRQDVVDTIHIRSREQMENRRSQFTPRGHDAQAGSGRRQQGTRGT
jgi:uncharacterized protein (TIGR02118 family)